MSDDSTRYFGISGQFMSHNKAATQHDKGLGPGDVMVKGFRTVLALGFLMTGLAPQAPAEQKGVEAEFLACYEKGDWKCAEDVISKALKKDSKKPLHWLLHAELMRATGEAGKALESYDKAIELNPEDKVALAQRASLLMSVPGEQEKGVADFRKLHSMNPAGFEENLNLGATLVYTKNFDEAIGYLEKAMEMQPGHKMAKINLATAYQGTGKHAAESDKLWLEIEEQYPDEYNQFRKKAV